MDAPSRVRVVGSLGVAQTLAWGSSYYLPAVLAAPMARELGITQKFTRAYRPQTNGKAERFIQSALREWAYGHTYENSQQRCAALPIWTHFYNWHRPHHGIDLVPPISRLSMSPKNLLTLHI